MFHLLRPVFVQLNALDSLSWNASTASLFPFLFREPGGLTEKPALTPRSHLTWTHPSWRRTPRLPEHFPRPALQHQEKQAQLAKEQTPKLRPCPSPHSLPASLHTPDVPAKVGGSPDCSLS